MYYDDEMTAMPMMNKLGGFVAGVLLGALAGAAVMWLYAPDSGAKTRKKLAKRAARLRDSVGNTYDETVEMARERAEQMKGQVRGRLDDAEEYGQEMLEEQKNKVEAVVQAGRKLLKRR